MSFLSSLTDGQIQQVISLPYLIGLSVSHADDVEGEHDDKLEMRTLHSCLKAVAERYEKKEVVAEILAATMNQRAEWGKWAETGNLYNIAPAAQAAANLILQHSNKEAARDFRAAMMEIAGAVARASGEFSAFTGMDDSAAEQGAMQSVFGRLLAGFGARSGSDAHHPMNVSAAEDEVLSNLSQALKV